MGSYTLFETHGHYDHERFKSRGPEIVRELYIEGVIDGLVIPAITYESNFNRDFFPKEQYPYVYFAAGLHPNSAINESWWNLQRRLDFDRILQDERTVAVKTGLDFSKMKLTYAQKSHQIRFLKYLIEQANSNQLPLVFHVRDAAEEMLDVLGSVHLNVEAVVHCYTYDYVMAVKLMDAGITKFGIGSKIERPDMDMLREAVALLPFEKILVETDAPFIKPEGFEGDVNTSKSLIRTARIISDIKQLPLSQVVQILQKNAYDFYNLTKEGNGR